MKAKFKLIYILHALLTILLIYSATSKSADTILERRYTFTKLDGLWKSGLAQNIPDETWFSDMVSENSDYQVTMPDASPSTLSSLNDDLPFDGVIIGEDVTPPSTGDRPKVRTFPIIAVPGNVAAQVYKRIALLEIYLNRYLAYYRSTTDTAANIDALDRRFKSAMLESYLLNMLLYFSESTFEKKCLRLEKVAKLEERGLSQWESSELLPQWQGLWGSYTAAKGKFTRDVVRQMVCKVRPTRTRGEMEKIVQNKVKALIYQKVKKTVEDTFILLGQASAKFQALVNQMNFEIKTKEIMELEGELANVQANMVMVRDDMLLAGVLIQKLKQVDLSLLKADGGVNELKDANALADEMSKKIVESLKSLGPLAAVAEGDLSSCKGLEIPYQNIDFNEDTGTLADRIVPPYETCLTKAKDMVARYKKPSALKKLMGEFSKLVLQISGGILGDSGTN